MQLTFDIGNSAIKGGLYSDGVLEHTFRTPHAAASLSSAILAEIQDRTIQSAGIASVVPDSTRAVARLLEEHGVHVTVVRYDMTLPFEVDYKTPHTLGADRLAAAAACWVRYGADRKRSVVALDAGTAFTYEVVSAVGVYLGGTIAPGPGLMQRSLNRETAQLPEVPLEMPQAVIGRSTVEAIQAGIMHGFVESVRGLLRRINDELREEAFVVATGGWSELLREHIDAIDAIEPHLVLEGVRVLMEMNT